MPGRKGRVNNNIFTCVHFQSRVENCKGAIETKVERNSFISCADISQKKVGKETPGGMVREPRRENKTENYLQLIVPSCFTHCFHNFLRYFQIIGKCSLHKSECFCTLFLVIGMSGKTLIKKVQDDSVVFFFFFFLSLRLHQNKKRYLTQITPIVV